MNSLHKLTSGSGCNRATVTSRLGQFWWPLSTDDCYELCGTAVSKCRTIRTVVESTRRSIRSLDGQTDRRNQQPAQ